MSAPIRLSQTLQPGAGCPRGAATRVHAHLLPARIALRAAGLRAGLALGRSLRVRVPGEGCVCRGPRATSKQGDAQAARLLRASPRRSGPE